MATTLARSAPAATARAAALRANTSTRGARSNLAQSAQTTLNYTGQRLDSTGLLYYHARMYDPVLARFVSADSIAPGKDNPQMRNRYTYTLNNPLKYTDPTGHCSQYAKDSEEENEKCRAATKSLHEVGMLVDNMWDWTSGELRIILEAAYDLMRAASWSVSDFIGAMGNSVSLVRGGENKDYAAFESNGTITFYNSAFQHGRDEAKRIAVHEMAHRWDEASDSKLTAGMAAATGTSTDGCSDIIGRCWSYTRKEIGIGPRPEARDYYHNPYEEFAESVAVTVYPHAADVNPDFGGSRYTFVREQFKNYRSNETS